MNYLIQRGKMRQQAIAVPEGLPELLADITREVLRCQPTKECLCQFIIDYLHSVIVTREKALVAKTILDRALRQVDSIISDLCICDLTREKSELMGQVLEECFTKFLEKRRCDMRRGKQMVNFEDVDILEELLAKCKFTDEELNVSRPAIDSAYKRFVEAYMSAQRGADGTEVLYQYFRDREMKRIDSSRRTLAAITIQSAWRGYWVRSQFPREVCVCICATEKEDDEEENRRNSAALVLQRFFRSAMRRAGTKPVADPCADASISGSREGTPKAAVVDDNGEGTADSSPTITETEAVVVVPATAPGTAAGTAPATAPGTASGTAAGTVTATARSSAIGLGPEEVPAEAPPVEAAEEEEQAPPEAPPEEPPAEAAEAPQPEEAPAAGEEAAPAAEEEAPPAAAEEAPPAAAEEAAPPAEEAPPTPAEEAPAEAAAE